MRAELIEWISYFTSSQVIHWRSLNKFIQLLHKALPGVLDLRSPSPSLTLSLSLQSLCLCLKNLALGDRGHIAGLTCQKAIDRDGESRKVKKRRVRETYKCLCVSLNTQTPRLLFALICPAGHDRELIVYSDKLKGMPR